MYKKVRILVVMLLLAFAATSLHAAFDQAFVKHWYSDATMTVEVGWRYQGCDWAHYWGEETEYETVDMINDCCYCTEH